MIWYIARDFDDTKIGRYRTHEEAISAFQEFHKYFDSVNAAVFVEAVEYPDIVCLHPVYDVCPDTVYDGLLCYKYIKFNNSLQRFLRTAPKRLILHYINKLEIYDTVRLYRNSRKTSHVRIDAGG